MKHYLHAISNDEEGNKCSDFETLQRLLGVKCDIEVTSLCCLQCTELNW